MSLSHSYNKNFIRFLDIFWWSRMSFNILVFFYINHLLPSVSTSLWISLFFSLFSTNSLAQRRTDFEALRLCESSINGLLPPWLKASSMATSATANESSQLPCNLWCSRFMGETLTGILLCFKWGFHCHLWTDDSQLTGNTSQHPDSIYRPFSCRVSLPKSKEPCK